MKILIFLSAIFISISTYSLPVGDTRGNVIAIRVLHANANAGKSSFQIWFDNETHDRWGCIAGNGYVVVREDGEAVTPESYKMLFSTALAAQAAGKILVVDSASSSANPCINANTAWIEN